MTGPSLYQRWIYALEERALRRDNNRVVRPFSWGLEYLGIEDGSPNPQESLRNYVGQAFVDSEQFFAAPPQPPFQFHSHRLSFPSAIQNHHTENNTVHARYFPRRETGAAVVVLPQWNADHASHLALCRLLNRFGMSALRMSLPFHDDRRPPELERADYLVDSNIGRTIQSCRQAVLDTRLGLAWLRARGYQRLGVLGTSIGACVAFLTFAHDPEVQAGVFNHASSYFADVVWNGMTTRHVRRGLEGKVTLEELRDYWSIISPVMYVRKLRGQARGSLVVSGRYDPTFLPELTQRLFDEYEACGVPLEKVLLPCGHYTLGSFPFSWIDGYVMARFLRARLLQDPPATPA